MWKIKNVSIESNVVLAPMAGITSIRYREYLKKFGVGYSVTEMISDAGIVYRNQKTINYLKMSKLDRPIALQLFGNKLENTLKAIDIINNELHIEYDILDLNFGCPVKKVFNNDAGSAWLKDLKKMSDYVKKIVQHSVKPVTAKIRLGIDEKHINVNEVVSILIKSGISAIAIHARTSKQKYTGKANYKVIENIGKKMSVPLIISGDIFTLNDAIEAVKITGATAVMVARGAVGNPYLITQIDQYFKQNIKLKDVNILDNTKYCRELALALIEEKGEKTAMCVLKRIAPNFFNKFNNAKKIKSKIVQFVKNYDDLNKILEDVERNFSSNGNIKIN